MQTERSEASWSEETSASFIAYGRFFNPERERQLLEELASANPGPLSPEGLHELVSQLLDLTKREVTRDDGKPG